MVGWGGASVRAQRLLLAIAMIGVPRAHAASVACDTVVAPPGAVYLHSDAPTSTTFNGNSFVIDGRDHTLVGDAGPLDAIFGVATRTAENKAEAIASLSNSQLDNIQGRGYQPGPPIVTSIDVVDGPDAVAIDAIVADVIARASTVVDQSSTLTGMKTLGTVASPQVTHLPGTGGVVTVAAAAQVSGAGTLVVDGGLTVLGDFDFTGLVVVRGPLVVNGSGLVWGSVWTTNVSALVGGNLQIYYASEALALAGGTLVCDASTCGDGTLDAGEQCDDGNRADGDCCASDCTFEASGAACTDDASACTTDHCDGAGACVHAAITCDACLACDPALGCMPTPALYCQQPLVQSKSRLLLSIGPVAEAARLDWRWQNGELTTFADFGDPPGDGGADLCVYGGETGTTLLARASAPGAGLCDGRPCWRERGRALLYADRGAPAGITSLRLRSGPPFSLQGSIRAKGAAPALLVPALPVTPPILVQLRAQTGACWEAVYPASRTMQTDRRLIARGQL